LEFEEDRLSDGLDQREKEYGPWDKLDGVINGGLHPRNIIDMYINNPETLFGGVCQQASEGVSDLGGLGGRSIIPPGQEGTIVGSTDWRGTLERAARSQGLGGSALYGSNPQTSQNPGFDNAVNKAFSDFLKGGSDLKK